MKCPAASNGKIVQLALQKRLLAEDEARMMGERVPRLGSEDATRAALQQRDACILLDVTQALAHGRQRQAGPCSALRDAPRIYNAQEEPQVREVESHNAAFTCLRTIRRITGKYRIVRSCACGFNVRMHETFLFVALLTTTFLAAGLVKGVTGMGLPTVAMGLLGMVMPPAVAAAMLIIPSFVTNVWQLLAGPAIARLVRRLWAMMLAIVIGTLAGASLLVRVDPKWSALALGVALVIYAGYALMAPTLSVPSQSERWLSPIVGVVTGTITGATGVFVMPAVPYLQSLQLSRDDLVQALGLSFTVSTVALAGGLLAHGAFRVDQLGLSTLALVPALVGMWLGQIVRRRISAKRFRQFFLSILLLLGLELASRPFF